MAGSPHHHPGLSVAPLCIFISAFLAALLFLDYSGLLRSRNLCVSLPCFWNIPAPLPDPYAYSYQYHLPPSPPTLPLLSASIPLPTPPSLPLGASSKCHVFSFSQCCVRMCAYVHERVCPWVCEGHSQRGIFSSIMFYLVVLVSYYKWSLWFG